MITAETIKSVNERVKKIEVKGKNYTCVAARISAFRELCPMGTITTEILNLADGVVTMKTTVADENGKVLATCFYEPSTRTRLSFETAMIRLGGKCIGFSDASSSSASKGESVADTVRTISCFADICAMRHPKEGAPMVAASKSLIPVINGGDGGHHHPTQTLTDLLTIRSLHGSLNNFTIFNFD